jgi:hypothetical protein
MFLKVAKKSKIEEKQKLLAKIRVNLKNDEMAKKLLKEYKIKDWIFDAVPLDFKDLKVTAKTVNGTIYLNPKITEMSFNIVMRYVIHEFVHVLQHISEEKNGEKENDKKQDYLDREDEIEAFQHQIEYDAKHRGVGAAEKYTDELLDYHKISGKDKKEKKKELMEKVK